MRYLSEVLHDNTQQQHKVSRGERRNSEKTLCKLETINPMRICKATRAAHSWKYTMGSQTLKNTIIFIFLFFKKKKSNFTHSLLEQYGFYLLQRGVTICEMTLQSTLQSPGETKQLNSTQVRFWEWESLCGVWGLCKHLNLRTYFTEPLGVQNSSLVIIHWGWTCD